MVTNRFATAPSMLERDRVARVVLLAAALLCAWSFAARAQGNVVERQVKAASGRDVRVGVYTDIRPDCTPGPLPAIKLSRAPAHGAVSVKRGTLKATNFKQCLATEVPAFVVYYRAAGDFIGTDEFELEVSSAAGGKQVQRFRVNVSSSPGGGQGI
jgi:hypothetical protein